MVQQKSLTPSEEYVMKAIWECKKEPVLQDVLRQVNDLHGKDWAPQTVSTYLGKLCQKGYILLQRRGKTCSYKILVSERDYQKSQLKRMLIFIYNDNAALLNEDLEDLK